MFNYYIYIFTLKYISNSFFIIFENKFKKHPKKSNNKNMKNDNDLHFLYFLN